MFRSTDNSSINPAELNQSTSKLLAKFLLLQGSETINKGTSYEIADTDSNAMDKQIRKFSLTNDIIKRPRKENKEGFRYEVIDSTHRLGKGGEGVVLKSLGVLIISSGDVFFKEKPRAVKEHFNRNSAYNEYKHSKRIEHLSVKPVACLGWTSNPKARHTGTKQYRYFIAMNLIAGVNLYP